MLILLALTDTIIVSAEWTWSALLTYLRLCSCGHPGEIHICPLRERRDQSVTETQYPCVSSPCPTTCRCKGWGGCSAGHHSMRPHKVEELQLISQPNSFPPLKSPAQGCFPWGLEMLTYLVKQEAATSYNFHMVS